MEYRHHPALRGAPDLECIQHADGRSWKDVRATLKPNFGKVWLDVALCYAMCALGLFAHAAITQSPSVFINITATVFLGIWIAYWLHALSAFGHEAAHSNFAPHHNDMLANWIVWLPFSQTTAQYRSTHWNHHLHLGDHDDTEISYQNCLNIAFLLSLMTGIYFLIQLRKYVLRQDITYAAHTSISYVAIIRTMLFLGGIFAALATSGHLLTAVCWFLSVFCFFPLISAVRQTMEHRQLLADCTHDFSVETHGAVNRLFGNDVFSRYLGAAGFNKHLLHHWEPTVSYTRFQEMEEFLLGTPLKEHMEQSRTTYGKTLKQMLRSALYGS